MYYNHKQNMKLQPGYCRPVALCIGAVLAVSLAAHGEQCHTPSATLTVGYTEQKLFSPGYPAHYNNNMDCVWTLEAASNFSTGFGIQLATVELQLEPDYEATMIGQCETDYLELFVGTPMNLGQRLGIWCGSDKKTFTSTNTPLTLKFHSNGHHTSKGFVLEYALVKLVSPVCQPGNTSQIYVGQAPVYIGFTVKNNESNCMWSFEAIDTSGATDYGSTLVVEALSIPRVWCRNGKFVLSDGLSHSQVLHWCNGGEAFSVVYLSSNQATLAFVSTGSLEFTSDTIQLKLFSRDVKFPQACSDLIMPEVHVGRNPVYFHIPFATDIMGNKCSVLVSQRTDNSYLRVDVMSLSGHLPTCDTDIITVRRAKDDKEQVDRSCNRRQYPMYIAMTSAAVVSSVEQVLLRVISSDPVCSGVSSSRLATTSLIMEDRIPRGFTHGIPTHSNCVSKYLIVVESDNLTIALKLEWTAPQTMEEIFTNSDACPGDFLNIYDGKNESSSLLFSTCHKTDRPNFSIEERIIGTNSNMLIVFNSDDVADASVARLSYYAVPKNTECSKTQQITVTKEGLELTSPNYPDFYPLDYDCTYRVTAKSPADVIAVEVVDSKFSRSCQDIVHVYNGETGVLLKDYVSHFCGGGKNQKFIINQHEAVIRFRSDQIGLSSSWKLRLHSQNKAPSGRHLLKYGDLLFLLWSFVVGFLLFRP